VDKNFDVIIIGAGAAGLFCAFNAGQRGKRVLVLDHANKVGKKILMSGGGRCNFTNLNTTHEDFTSQNPHFCKSALNQYSPYSFLSLVEESKIEYVEKGPGQLFCKNSSKDILKLLLDECAKVSVKIFKKCDIKKITKDDEYFIETSIDNYLAKSLVIATGGLSIPTLGASGFGYEIAKQFKHDLIDTSASLVPFTLSKKILQQIASLAGVSQTVCISDKVISIEDDLLFTHRGLSGPAILRLSATWQYADEIEINFLPGKNITEYLQTERLAHPDKLVINSLSSIMPKRLAAFVCGEKLHESKLKQLEKKSIDTLKQNIHHWRIVPTGTEGYKTAEVTSGGVNTDQISSKTLESKLSENLYFIGEVLDVTGQLGGYNFQWAWASAWCAAQAIR